MSRTLLWVLVNEKRWTFPDFAREFTRAADRLAEDVQDARFRGLSISESSYRRLLSGKPGNAKFAQVVEHMFGRPTAELLTGAGGSDVRERAAAGLARGLATAADEAADHATAVASLLLSEQPLDQVRLDIARLAATYNGLAPADACARAGELRARAVGLLDRTHVAQQKERLLTAVGEATALLSMSAFDLGHVETAARLARSTAMYGEAARCTPLQAFALGTMATAASWEGRAAEAVRLARTGAGLAGVGTAGLRRLASVEARACARLGDEAGALAAVARCDELAAGPVLRDDLHDGAAGEFRHDEMRLARSHGTTFLLLGAGARSMAYARLVLDLQAALPPEQRVPRFEAEARADLAAALLLGARLEEAAEVLEPVLTCAPDRRVAGLVSRVSAVRALLAAGPPRRAALAVGLDRALEAFVSEAVPGGPGRASLAVAVGT
ncbi:DNA-binding protein [Streptomyces sp. NPDC089919]|uniref:DNA-binding protein n=1 Tax=Streptomyces sp. NPDC089919 TaxID=3155188 RepID=UPI00341E8949